MTQGKATVQLVGNLSRDVEVRFTNSQMAVAKFGIAVSTRSGKGDDAKEKTSFFTCKAFGKSAEAFAKFHKKGSRAIIFGRMEEETWDDKQTGAKRSAVVVLVDDWCFTGERSSQGGQGESRPARASVSSVASDDDTPF